MIASELREAIDAALKPLRQFTELIEAAADPADAFVRVRDLDGLLSAAGIPPADPAVYAGEATLTLALADLFPRVGDYAIALGAIAVDFGEAMQLIGGRSQAITEQLFPTRSA